MALTATDLGTGPLAKKLLLPWNWFRGAYAANAMVARFETAFGKGTLLLPDHPRFVFCATDMLSTIVRRSSIWPPTRWPLLRQASNYLLNEGETVPDTTRRPA